MLKKMRGHAGTWRPSVQGVQVLRATTKSLGPASVVILLRQIGLSWGLSISRLFGYGETKLWIVAGEHNNPVTAGGEVLVVGVYDLDISGTLT